MRKILLESAGMDTFEIWKKRVQIRYPSSFQTGMVMLNWMLTCTAFAEEPVDYIVQVEANLENGTLNLTFDERAFDQTVIQRRSLGSGWNGYF